MYRAKDKQGLRQTLAFYVAAGAVAGALAGALLGWIGGLLSLDVRVLLGTVLGLVAVGIGLTELSGRRIPLVQLDRETPVEWIDEGPVRWALRNGLAIGLGAGNRLGFWLWYVIPIGALLSGDPLVGALGYGCYGLIRTMGAAGMIFLFERGRIDREGRWILEFFDQARGIAATQLAVVGLAALLIFGV